MFLNTGRTYPKTMATFRAKQQVVRAPKISVFPVARSLFVVRIARPAIILIAVMIGLNFFMASMVSSTVVEREAVASVRHDLVDENIALRSERLGLLSENAIHTMAGERLSLVTPDGHRYTFSR